MSFAELYAYAEGLNQVPIRVETDLVPKVKTLAGQDDVFFTPVELDTEISFGHIKQYRMSTGVYAEPRWVTDIRYAKTLNICWRRYVGCKELMHVFDMQEERSDSAAKFNKLLDELESTPLLEDASQMFLSENRTKWKALAVLCPLPIRQNILDRRAAGELADPYEIALELRVPQAVVGTILGETFERVLNGLIGRG